MFVAASTSFSMTARFRLLVLLTIGPRPTFSKTTMRITTSGVLDSDGNDASGQAGMIRRRDAGYEDAVSVKVNAAGVVSPSFVMRDGHNSNATSFNVQVFVAGSNDPSGEAGMVRRRGVGNEDTVDMPGGTDSSGEARMIRPKDVEHEISLGVPVNTADLCGQTCQDVFATMSTSHYVPCDAFYFPPCFNQTEVSTDSAKLHELCPLTCQRESEKDAERQRAHSERMAMGAFERTLRVHWGVGLSLIILSALIVVATKYLSKTLCCFRRSGKQSNLEYDKCKQQAKAEDDDDTDDEGSDRPFGEEVTEVLLPQALQL